FFGGRGERRLSFGVGFPVPSLFRLELIASHPVRPPAAGRSVSHHHTALWPFSGRTAPVRATSAQCSGATAADADSLGAALQAACQSPLRDLHHMPLHLEARL